MATNSIVIPTSAEGAEKEIFLNTYYIVLYVVKMQKVITVRLEDGPREKIAEIARQKLESRSDIIREALMEYIRKETEMREIKKIVAKKFAEGKVSFEELVKVLGYEEAKRVAFFVDIAEKSFREGL